LGDRITYVGLDGHKDGIVVAVAEGGLRREVQEYARIANMPAALQPAAAHGPSEFATMLYFSVATLTTTGYGDIVPLNPFARSLANLESVIGPFYLAITVAPLVTLEVADRPRSRQ
jgi:voltage-gated potassium channel Kch